MNILISNDDGIYAEGIKILKNFLEKAGHKIYVTAPLDEQSGAGHGITLHSPLRIKEIERDGKFFGYGINGKPADCVKIGLLKLFKDKSIDLVISGINKGTNLGTDIFYSGTFGAAAEGSLLGVKSIALSLCDILDNNHFETAANFIVKYCDKIKNIKFPKDTLLNINVPNIVNEDIKGYVYTKQGDRRYLDNIIERIDTQGNKYYWLGGKASEKGEDLEIDFVAVKQGFISITPIKLDMYSDELKKILD
ncbi:5'-nucleotidase /3'-nucleotidase /exopolyphosphatase [Hypnocyclicus thermotrophus]|uniref:5'-nucleotidase SurE n=1 Tax=Hypnocyclicus thermotrophus TaxID=1627895 RepID=A0AA46DXV9_9FUSO|nr:5'/3'-nucleotidase SurE [Hypnocyclicus thermotrophus]TDT69164.1 5'-nucleotidase /3'-nucleotidase /exopolyphosphatase [Hypnocyclicus thermotrophus]